MKAKYATYAGGLALVAAMIGLAPAPASAQAILYNGANLAIGIDSLGQMNVAAGLAANGVTVVAPANSGSVGLSFFTDYGPGFGPQWNDATSPGCVCEGWGVAADGTSGWVSNAIGVSNLGFGSYVVTGGGSGALVTTNLTSLPGLSVLHDYHPSVSPSLYEAIVTITNGTGAAVADVRYNRTMDWDIPTNEFSEYVTIQGWPATALIDSGDNGFQQPDPLLPSTSIIAPTDANFVDSGAADHGARFTFGFGGLAAGASKTFKIFYGATVGEAAALTALGAVGAEVYSLGQMSPPGSFTLGTPATFIFGFAGVGGTPVPVPEPGALFLLGSGLATVLIRRRARRS